jgi:hypothetical protein
VKKTEERKAGKELREKEIINGNTEEIKELKYYLLYQG